MHYKSIKTQKVQYADDDNHPVKPNAIHDSRVSFNGKDESVLSGSVHNDTKLSKIVIK